MARRVEVRSPTGLPMDTTIVLDGQDVTKFCQSYDLHCDGRGLATVALGLIAGALDVVLTADVAVTIQAFEGSDIVAEPQADGSTRYRVERIQGGARG
jgi:hypothetical protein